MKYRIYLDTGFYWLNEMEYETDHIIDLGVDIDNIMVQAIKMDLADYVCVNDLIDYQEYEEDENYIYLDLTMEDMEVYFINILNFRYELIKE